MRTYKRYLIFVHWGQGTMGGYYHGLDAVAYHSDNYDLCLKEYEKYKGQGMDAKVLDLDKREIVLSCGDDVDDCIKKD
jgi:hypothetical protein